METHGNQLSRYGALSAVMPELPPQGKAFFVLKAGLAWSGDFGFEFKPDRDGLPRVFPTIAAVISASVLVAGRGDVIYLMPGHTESISSATALTLSVAGVQIIGLGTGGTRPTITLDTANTATINVTAANITIKNVIFIANFLAVAAAFTLTTAKDFQLINCEFRDTSASLNFIAIVVVATTSNAADGLLIDSCKFFLLATSGAIKIASALGTNDRWTIKGNYWSTPTTNAGAVLPIAAGKILTNFLLLNNRFNLVNATGTSTGYLITTNGSTNTGLIDGNIDFALPTTPLQVTASSGFVYGANYHSDTADLSGYLLPAADS